MTADGLWEAANWTIASALYQLRWEPTERRSSAVTYLQDIVYSGRCDQVREIASGLLIMASDLIAAEEPLDEEEQ
jgi:hypothetical protein